MNFSLDFNGNNRIILIFVLAAADIQGVFIVVWRQSCA